MARQANFFALLDGVDGDEDMAALVDRLAAKVVEESVRLAAEETTKKEQLPQKQTPSVRSGFQSSYDARQQGRGLQGRGSMKNVGSNEEFIENNQTNGYQHNHGPNNGRGRRDNIHQANYRRNTGSQGGDYSGNDGNRRQASYTRNGGYTGNYGRGDGYEGEYGQFNGYGRGRGRPDHRINKGGDYRQNDGYQGEDRHVDCYGPANGRSGYYRRNYNGDFANGNWLEQGLDLGRGSGRGSNQERGYWRKSHVVKANEQLESDKQVMDSEINHEKVFDGQSNEEMRQTRNVNGILSGHEGEQDVADGVLTSTETKEVNAIDNGVNSDGNTVASDGPSVNEVSKDPKVKQKKSLVNRNTRKSWKEMTDEEKKAEQKRRAGERAKEIEEDKKLFTLEQYEKILLEKKKALLAVSRTEERHVAVDKDFDTMQPIVKKKEDVTFIKAHSEKDQMVKKDIIKGEKANKLKNACEFFQTPGGRKSEVRDDQYLRRAAFVNVKIDDQSQFPVLGRSAK